MPQVVIVGAGVIGASIAWHLSELGCTDVLVVDRAPSLGGGSTPLATGGFRTQFATEVNVRMSLLSREKLRQFPEEIGVDSGYRPYGYLFLAMREATLAVLRDAQRVQHACGVMEARMVSSEEARAINPVVGDVAGGAYCPTDGFIRAMQILRGYHDAAARGGARFELGVEVHGLRAVGDRVVALQTSGGEIEAEHVVNAAGAWASTFGFDVPVTPLRRRVAPTIVTDALPETMPMTIWTDDGYHIRVRDGRVLLLWPDPAPPGFDTSLDEAWLAQVRAYTDERVPLLRDVPIDRAQCWAGLYEMSPDKHAIVGRAPHYANAWLANGSSGHGVMHAPAIGHLVAGMITGAPPPFDVRALRPERFAEGAGASAASLL
ncbi:MAG TPA: FAD-dependent oxidoreductase [Thermoanaerobaculia bacterium]|nr:FAD-dependent oxidoreductase [Thermoanaerobaculia bacterium]